MATWQSTLLWIYVVLLGITALRFIVYLAVRNSALVLKVDSPLVAPENAPKVSVMVPAKDEEDSIEECVRSLMDLNYPDYEILIVDDRSIDRTPEIVQELAEEDERVRLIQIKKLADGWTGKNHALHNCVKEATGDWYLFVDADTQQHPNCLSAALRDCLDHDAKMSTLLPALKAKTFWEGVIQPFGATLLMMLYPLYKVNDPRRKDYGFGNGQFILMEKGAYETIGGHETVRDKFVEDIHLGRQIRQHDFGLRVLRAPEVFTVRMYSSFEQIQKGWARILYSAADCKPGKLIGLLMACFFFSLIQYLVLITGGAMFALGITSVAMSCAMWMAVIQESMQMILFAMIYRDVKTPLKYLPFRLFGVLGIMLMLCRTIRMTQTHKVEWRGTTYASEDAKSGPGINSAVDAGEKSES